jgi:hypothetical protein
MQFNSVFPGLSRAGAVAVGALGILASGAYADTISPTSYSATLGVGESVTITKTVVVTREPPTTALVDIMFVFDTTGSMGGAIDGAKASATSVLNTIAATYGNTFSGAGQYDDPGSSIVAPLSNSIAATQAGINTLFACYGSCGGDFPEVGYDGIAKAASDTPWRAGSNRFIVAFGDASFKDGADNAASTATALSSANVDLFGVSFGSAFDSEITGLGGSVFTSSTSPDDIAAAILAGVSAGFSTYKTVTVGDLGGGLPEIAVSAVCTSADTGACVGADAVGTYDRSVERTFTFDYTFTRVAAGDKDFDTYALVDRGIVATERDSFKTPEPATLVLMGVSLLGLGASRRRRSA